MSASISPAFVSRKPPPRVPLWCAHDRIVYVAPAGAKCPKCKRVGVAAELKTPKSLTKHPSSVDTAPQSEDAAILAAEDEARKKWEADHAPTEN
jgi:hypothetical protein